MSPRPPGPDTLPLVGRDRELAVLRGALVAGLAGQGGLILVGGAAGIGKTTVAESILADAVDVGVLVLTGRCYDLTETPPYGAWLDLFAHYRAEDGLPPPPDVFARPNVVGVTSSQLALSEQCVEFFRALATVRRIAVLFDDLHWGDSASLELLRLLTREAHDLSLIFIATYRPDERRGALPLYSLLPTIVRESRPTRVDLAPLDMDAIAQLVAARYPLPEVDASRLARYLAQRSDGNAFFLGELLRALEEEGGLIATATGWRIADLRAARVPPLVRQVLGNRLVKFSEEERGALALAAVIGQEVPLDLWQRIGGLGEALLLALIEHAVAAQVLVASDDGDAVRFYHALTRETLYEGMLPPRRRAWHRAIGEALAAMPSPSPDAVAHHFERASDPRAGIWLVRAGEQAQAAYAYLMAAERYETAMRFLSEGEATPGARGWLAFRLAWLGFYNDPPRSTRRVEEVLQLAEQAGDRELVACARFSHGHFLVTGADFRAGLRDMRAGIAALDALPDGAEVWRTALRTLKLSIMEPFRPHGVLTATLAYIGHYAEARAVGEGCIAPRDAAGEAQSGYPLGDMQAYLGLGIAYASLGEPELSRRAFAASRETLRNSTEFLLSTLVDLYELTFRVYNYHADDLAERQRLVEVTNEVWAIATGPIDERVYVLHAGYRLDFLEGRWEELRTIAQRGIIIPPVRFFQYAVLGELDYATGDTAGLARRVREVLPAGPATEPGGESANTALAYQRLASVLALDAGDLPAACAWLEAHDRFLRWSGAVPGRAEGQTAWAAYYRTAGDLPRALSHATEAVTLAGQPRQPLALLAARRLLGELETGAGNFDQAEEQIAAAVVLAESCAAPYERALCLLALVNVCIAKGERERAQAGLAEACALFEALNARPALARAAEIAARLAAPTPRSGSQPFGLTPREVEVLRLVAQGLPYNEIAERLFLSPRTVGTHLTNIFAKLGVENRAAATRLASEHGLA